MNNSQFVSVCLRMHSIASGSQRARLYVGITTLTLGRSGAAAFCLARLLAVRFAVLLAATLAVRFAVLLAAILALLAGRFVLAGAILAGAARARWLALARTRGAADRAVDCAAGFALRACTLLALTLRLGAVRLGAVRDAVPLFATGDAGDAGDAGGAGEMRGLVRGRTPLVSARLGGGALRARSLSCESVISESAICVAVIFALFSSW